MPDRPRPPAAAVALTAAALFGTSCGADAPAPAVPPATTATDPATAPGAVDVPADRIGRAHQAALGLVALGTLGAERGTGAALAAQVTATGQAVDERIRAVATGAGIVLGDDLGAADQALVAEVGGRTGPAFDAGWRQAVLDLAQEVRGAADAVRDSAAPEEAKAAAGDVLARVDALDAAVRGAVAPAAVPAGSGGQAGRTSPVPIALVGLGVLLLAAALRLRRPAG